MNHHTHENHGNHHSYPHPQVISITIQGFLQIGVPPWLDGFVHGKSDLEMDDWGYPFDLANHYAKTNDYQWFISWKIPSWNGWNHYDFNHITSIETHIQMDENPYIILYIKSPCPSPPASSRFNAPEHPAQPCAPRPPPSWADVAPEGRLVFHGKEGKTWMVLMKKTLKQDETKHIKGEMGCR